MTVTNEIGKSFNQHATQYELAAKVQQEIGARLYERLQYLKIEPRNILDLGCGTGYFSRQLSLMYPKAHIVGMDLAPAMLQQARAKHTWRRKWSLTAANMHTMPFATGVFDLVFANQVVHWSTSLVTLFREINRIMNVNGCLMFTTLGPDTFKELKTAWSGVNSYAHVNQFADMHDVGDILMAEHFLEPVMDMELLAVHYETLTQLVKSLKSQGVRNINPQRNPGLTGKASWSHFEKNYQLLQTQQGKYPLTYEVVYGHAWKGKQSKTDRGIETFIPLNQIRKG